MHQVFTNVRLSFTLPCALIVLTLAAGGCGGPPQMADNDECFSAVDALWTAVGSRRADLLSASEARLTELHDAQSLNDASFTTLQSVIDLSKAGEWKTARANLRAFMEGQRRGR